MCGGAIFICHLTPHIKYQNAKKYSFQTYTYVDKQCDVEHL